jgi:hypothetical protein
VLPIRHYSPVPRAYKGMKGRKNTNKEMKIGKYNKKRNTKL